MFRGCSGNVSICSTSGLEPTTFAAVSTTIRPGRAGALAGALCDKFPIFITVNSQPPQTNRLGLIRPGGVPQVRLLRPSEQPDPHSLAFLCPCYGSPDISSSVLSQQGATQVISGHYGSTGDKRSPHPARTPCLTQREQESEQPQNGRRRAIRRTPEIDWPRGVIPRARPGEFPGQVRGLQYGSEGAVLLGSSDNAPSSRCWFLKGGHRHLLFSLTHRHLRLRTARGIAKYRLKGIRPLLVSN
jgi:hypothetical protein